MNLWREIYRIENIPVTQNRMFATSDEAISCPQGDVVLVQDMSTGLIFNSEFKPEIMQYGQEYQNEQACSAVFRKHVDEVTDVIQSHFTGRSLIEIGCGKGYFLEHLQAEGFSVSGVDPAYEGDNPGIAKTDYSSSLKMTADGIVLRHVLEHVPRPIEFLETILQANGGRGKIYIETPCFDWICQHRAWFDIHYEHVNYFRLTDFENMFGHVYESKRLFGDQYLAIVADLSTLRTPAHSKARRADVPSDMFADIAEYADLLKSNTANDLGGYYAIWGGAAKGVLFSLLLRKAGLDHAIVFDINPAKQGKHLAGSGLRVHSPDELVDLLKPGSIVFVMNSNYIDEIRQITSNAYKYVGIDHE